jgi:hypothetical protein
MRSGPPGPLGRKRKRNRRKLVAFSPIPFREKGKPFYVFSNLSINCKLIFIQIKFELHTIPTHKTKSNNMQSMQKKNYAMA